MEENSLRKYLSLSLILIVGISILYMLRAYLTPILGAIILSYLLMPLYDKLKNKTQKPILSAALVLLGLFLVILIPLSTTAGIMLSQLNSINVEDTKFIKYEESLSNLLGKEISITESLENVEKWIKSEAGKILPKVVSLTSNFLLSTFIMFFIMFYLLIERKAFIKEFLSFSPFSKKHSNKLLKESGNVVRAVMIGQVLTAIVQGFLGMVSFIIVGLNGAIFWGIIMMILSIIPMIGAFIIWVPAGLFLLLEGFIWQGIFVLVWGAVIVSQIDNFIRPKLVNKFANIHPLETFLGIFMGISAFGFIGIIIGPLVISLFTMLVKTFRSEFNLS